MRLCAICVICVICGSVHAQQKHSNGIDNVLEFVPYASVFILKAGGVESRDDWTTLAVTTAVSMAASAGMGWVLKHTIKETRPDGSDQHSFPSGHSIMAFAGATALHKEFGSVSPWISVAGYGVATFVAVDRVLKERHHWYDVVAGAGIGIGVTEATWWLSKKVFKNKQDQVMVGFSGSTLDVAVRL